MRFEWDREKADANRRKHRVSFDEAASVFLDAFRSQFQPDHSVGEHRVLTMGLSSKSRILVVAHTEQGDAIRIITSRLASASERKRYET